MVCYIVPAIAAVAHYVLRKNVEGWKKNAHQLWLNLLLAGGAIFGIVDHWWNGELLLVSPNIASDLMLGVAITITTLVAWSIIVVASESRARGPSPSGKAK